jgi:hypothetical protein
MTERENILIKIKRMLALADDASNENEAALAAAMAHKFLEKHNLCISDIDDVSEVDTDIEENEVLSTGRLVNWKRKLLQNIAECFNCSTLIYTGHRWRRLVLVGTVVDMDAAKATYEYLSNCVERFAKQNVKGFGRSYVSSYKRGLVNTIGWRLRKQTKENKEEIVATTIGTELAVIKDANLSKYMGQFGNYKAPASWVNWGAYEHGQDDGHNIGLHNQIDHNSNKELH